jgi:hypothetical protein
MEGSQQSLFHNQRLREIYLRVRPASIHVPTLLDLDSYRETPTSQLCDNFSNLSIDRVFVVKESLTFYMWWNCILFSERLQSCFTLCLRFNDKSLWGLIPRTGRGRSVGLITPLFTFANESFHSKTIFKIAISEQCGSWNKIDAMPFTVQLCGVGFDLSIIHMHSAPDPTDCTCQTPFCPSAAGHAGPVHGVSVLAHL